MDITKILDKPYSFLALFLSPWKDEATLSNLRKGLSHHKICWEQLLFTASSHQCTALWYVQLRKDGLLEFLPNELQQYLDNLYELNVARNKGLRQGLIEIVESHNKQNIPVILLKGAATFCDNLYEDPGARLMQDLDLLVQPEHLEKAGEIMLSLGYKTEDDKTEASNRCAHLPPFFRPGSQVLVEIHHKIHHNWSGAILPVDQIWNNPLPAQLAEVPVHILPPVQRLYHNAAHALISHHTYIRSEVSLLHLIEFAHIAYRYQTEIDWGKWLSGSKRVKMDKIFLIYIKLAEKLLHLPGDPGINARALTGLHMKRIILAGNYLIRPDEKNRHPSSKSAKHALVAIAARAYYYCLLPAWMWKHATFSLDAVSFQNRWRFLYHKLTSKRSRENLGF